jgi:hypothetical protein
VRLKKRKIMIDKKKLIEELLDCVADATDTETQITSLTMAGMLMNQILDEALTIPAVVGQSEQLVCECGNKLTDKEVYFGQCLQCDKNVEE